MQTFPKKTIIAIGYGTAEANRFSSSQRRLMGMRASKLEAYRSLAEQIYGVHIDGNTTVENMAAKNDGLRSYIDAIIRGARVKRIAAVDADTYETVLEVDLTPQFYECFSESNNAINSCFSSTLGMPVSELKPALIKNPATVSAVNLAACNNLDCYNYPVMSGFTRGY